MGMSDRSTLYGLCKDNANYSKWFHLEVSPGYQYGMFTYSVIVRVIVR